MLKVHSTWMKMVLCQKVIVKKKKLRLIHLPKNSNIVCIMYSFDGNEQSF